MDYFELKKSQAFPKVYSNKRKRESEEVVDNAISPLENDCPNPSIWVELENEIERQLEANAEKNNLTVKNVKKMLQAVLTNEDVLKMVDDNLTNAERSMYDLKLTRAKTKELLGPDAPNMWTPKKSVAEILYEDFPEDSSDEEYNPHEESDEEKVDETVLEETVEEPLQLVNSKENIGQRTRSKLCLSQTPLEVIEQAFIPPDITTDMYNTDCENPDWLNFLKEFSQPLNENVEDDNDPEYNFLMDEEQEDAADKEELRMDRAVKVTKKELNELMSELFEYTQMLSSDDEEVKEEKLEPKVDSPQYQPPIVIIPSVVVNPVQDVVPECIVPKQCLLIRQQLRQHVQLTIQSFILTYKHPNFDHLSSSFKDILLNLKSLQKNDQNQMFRISNLDASLALMNDWEGTKENSLRTCLFRRNKLPEEIMKFCVNSTAFPYPFLLPAYDLSPVEQKQARFSPFEDILITLALYDIGENEGITMIHEELRKISGIIHEALIPNKSPDLILKHFQRVLRRKHKNPIKDLFINGKALEVDHYIIKLPKVAKKIHEQPLDLLPLNWKYFCENYKLEITGVGAKQVLKVKTE